MVGWRYVKPFGRDNEKFYKKLKIFHYKYRYDHLNKNNIFVLSRRIFNEVVILMTQDERKRTGWSLEMCHHTGIEKNSI